MSTDTRLVQDNLARKFKSSRITMRHLEFYSESNGKTIINTSEALYLSERAGLLDPGDIGIPLLRNVVNHSAVDTT